MNELNLYQLIQHILKYSSIIEGRCIVAEGYGNDLNTNNLEEFLQDSLGNITTTQKYPLAVILPPIETMRTYDEGWSSFKLNLYFLTTTFYDNKSNLYSSRINTFNNSTNYPICNHWKDMRVAAGDFRIIFNDYIRKYNLLSTVREIQHSIDIYNRISLKNNDRLSGVSLQFDVEIFTSCLIEDYPTFPPLLKP